MKTYTSDQHHVDRERIDREALWVLDQLTEAGYTAYLVGGGVRDLLMGCEPKDFDISTSAEPEEIKDLFGRRCLLIGRRFRLAHLRFGTKIIECATFRTGEPETAELIVRDNEWGTPEEDVLRRDFTINGLFYDAQDSSIIDYVGGVEDVERRLIRTIGKAPLRFKQDPVRMMRALKFRARFDLEIDNITVAAIAECKQEILKSAPARVLEELLRMLESGSARPFFDLLIEHGMLQLLLPTIASAFQSEVGDKMRALLTVADQGSYDRATLTAALVYPLLEKVIEVEHPKRAPPLGLIHGLCAHLVHELLMDAFPKFTRRLCHQVVFALESQYRITPLTRRKMNRQKLANQIDFPIALQLFKLRSLIDPKLAEQYEEWKELERPVEKPHARKHRRPKRRRRR